MLDLCLDALAYESLGLAQIDAEARNEAQNIVSMRLYALSKDTPAKTWWNADPVHPAIARALHVDPKQTGAVFALAPFRLWHDGERHLILAAYPAPRILGPVDPDWLQIEAVIAWEPRADTAHILGDAAPQIVGSVREGLYASPRDFFTAWLRARAAFFVTWARSRKGEWAHGATETDLTPGALALGSIDNINWRAADLPDNITTHGIDAGALNRAIIRSARLPRAHSAGLRAVA